MKSKYVCGRCGVAVGVWAKGQGSYWKHQNGGYGNRSCGRRPMVVERDTYEADIRGMVDAAMSLSR